MRRVLVIVAVLLGAAHTPLAQIDHSPPDVRPGAAVQRGGTTVVQPSLDELARDVDRAESVRAVKNLQRTYAQYSQYGLWNEMADLFAGEATYIFDDEVIKGRKAIVNGGSAGMGRRPTI